MGPLVDWSGATYRLIPSRFPPVSVYENLVANDRADALVHVENLTNPRLRSEARLADATGEDPRQSARLQNWNLAPFAYGNPDGSTFFDESRPCLEVAAERQTALAVSVAKRRQFLEHTLEPPIGLDMRMFKTPVEGRFLDLRHVDPFEVAAVAREIGGSLEEDAAGILFRPVDRPTGIAISIVTGDVLGRTLQTVHYRYMWNGAKMSLLYAFDEQGTPIDPDRLGSPEDCLAA